MLAHPKPLWRCPKCGAQLVTRNQWHSCGKFSLTELFARSDPPVLPLFRKFAALVRKCGPMTMIPQKTRVVFMQRVRFVAVYPRRDHLLVGIVLTSRQPHPRFRKIESVYAGAHVHSFRLGAAGELDATLAGWLCESYRSYGRQERLRAAGLKGRASLKQ